MSKEATPLYNQAHARSPEQAERMRSLEERGACVFCREYVEAESDNPIEIETDYWLVKKNDFPYRGTKHHLVVIPKEHAETISRLSAAAQEEFLAVVAQVEKKYQFSSYGLAMRSGDMHYNGGSIGHLHAHIIVGDTENPGHEPIRFKLSSRLD